MVYSSVWVLIDSSVEVACGGVSVTSTVGPGTVQVRSMNEVNTDVSAGAVVVIKIEVVSPGSAVVKV